ncbi:hypothetical protein AB0H57_06385 [Micromonospora sp. NPDC050686]|uniref:hypothetical protein n=1 Tax=Micromonospora sp. NPDC050686 TaxID=3154631 RepID=UPI0034102195
MAEGEAVLSALKAGALLHVGARASVQFGQPFNFRLIRVLDWVTYDGWVWLDGYQLNDRGEAAGLRMGAVAIPRRRAAKQRTAPDRAT